MLAAVAILSACADSSLPPQESDSPSVQENTVSQDFEKIAETEPEQPESLPATVLREDPVGNPPAADSAAGAAEVSVPTDNIAVISITGDGKEILQSLEVTFKDGDTVFDLTADVTLARGIQRDFSGRGKSVYITGIDNLYEMDRGPESGWIYLVNGVSPSMSCGAYTVNAGDIIEWRYTTTASAVSQ